MKLNRFSLGPKTVMAI